MIHDHIKELHGLPARELLPGHGLGPGVRNGASPALAPLIGLVVALLIVLVGAAERLQAGGPLPAPVDVRLGLLAVLALLVPGPSESCCRAMAWDPGMRNGASPALAPLIGLVVALLIVVVGAAERLQAAAPLPAPADVRLGLLDVAGSPGPRPEPGPASAQAEPVGVRIRSPLGAGSVGGFMQRCMPVHVLAEGGREHLCLPMRFEAGGRMPTTCLGWSGFSCVLFASCVAPLCVLFASYRLGNSAPSSLQRGHKQDTNRAHHWRGGPGCVLFAS